MIFFSSVGTFRGLAPPPPNTKKLATLLSLLYGRVPLPTPSPWCPIYIILNNRNGSPPLVLKSYTFQWRIPGGGGRIGRGPPFFRTILIFSGVFFFFFFACHPGGRSGRRTVPLPNNVNVGPKNSGEKWCLRDTQSLQKELLSLPPPPPCEAKMHCLNIFDFSGQKILCPPPNGNGPRTPISPRALGQNRLKPGHFW